MRTAPNDDSVTSLRIRHHNFGRVNRLIVVILTLALLLVGQSSSAFAAPQPHPALSGSFIQPYLVDEWSEATLESELLYLKRAGIDEVILQWTSDSGRSTTIFPTELAGFSQSSDTDVVERLLQRADKLGMVVHLGLQVNDEWWDTYANDPLWLDRELSHSKNLAEELWTKYGHHQSIAGWYLPFEVDNYHFPGPKSWDAITRFYVDSIAHLRGLKDMTISTAPFYNTEGGLGPDAWETMWAHILGRADVDAIALQDGVGAGHADTGDLAAWFSATRSAIKTARPTTQLWADTETFNPDFTSMPIGEVVANMRAVQPYVSKYWSYSYDHYTSPLRVSSTYDSTYRDYVRDGTVETAEPSTPDDLVVTAQDHQSVSLSWSAATDDTGIAGYFVMRDGELSQRVDASANCGTFDANNVGCATPGAPTSTQEAELRPGAQYEFSIVAFDAAGNLSGESISASVVMPHETAPVLVSLDAPYECSTPASPQYRDTGKELTDGTLGSASFADADWSGRLTNEPFACVVDLGSAEVFHGTTSRWLQDPGVGIALPSRIDVEASLTGEKFASVGTMLPGRDLPGVQAYTYRLDGVEQVSRFIRFTITPQEGDAWSFADEFEVRAQREDNTVTPTPTPAATPTFPTPTQSPAASPTPPESLPTSTSGDLYSTPGYHDVNGRRWHTECEPYSQTTRCRTDIWSTQVRNVNGRFVSYTSWHFNNLTYLPEMSRSQWSSNPLAKTGKFVSSGRTWQTECDTASTGRNGCRSHIWAETVVASPQRDGGYDYSVKWQWVFNNIVRFKS